MSEHKKREQAQAEHIKRQYMNRESSKIERLKKLNDKVKAPGKITGSIMGVIGALIMGAGMSLVMVWENMPLGLILGIPGMIIAVLAYLTYKLITNKRRKSHASEIIRLSDELITETGI